MALFNVSKGRSVISKIPEKLRAFIVGPDDDELISRVKSYSNFASYSADIWGDSTAMQTLGLLREVPAMLRDPVIQSCLALLMETSFQMNDKNQVMWPISPYDVIVKELEAFHEEVGMQQQAITLGYNELLWGNLPFKHHFDSEYRFVNFTPIADFTRVIPIIISGKTLGFLVEGKFCYPFEFSYAQLEYYKNLGGIYKNNFVQFAGSMGGEDIFGQDFQNEFIVAPSYLSAAAKPWRNINIIEDALLLNRMDQSNYYRIFSVNVGGSVHSKSAIRTLNYYRNLFKKVRRVSYGAGGMASAGAGQEFEIVLPKTERQGLEVTNVGGEVDVKSIKDLDTQYNKLFAALRVQPSQIGFGEENTNAIGDSSGKSYDRRFARTCKMLVYSVQKVIKNFDYLYLRSRGYDVKMDDWKYGSVSLSVLEDQDRADSLTTAINNLKELSTVLNSMQLQGYNKNYLVESVLGTALSATGVNVEEMLKVPEGEDQPQQGGGGEAQLPMLASLQQYRTDYLSNMLDVMDNVNVVSKEFITSARMALVESAEVKLIASSKLGGVSIPLASLDDGNSYMFPEDTPIDLSGSVCYMKGGKEQIIEDLERVKSDDSVEMATLDFNSAILIPSDLKVSLSDFNLAGIRALSRGYINSRGELILVDASDVATYFSMKKSGLFSCLVSRLYRVP